MMFVLLPLVGGCQSGAVDTALPPVFSVHLTPVVAQNQSPFEGVDRLAFILDPDGAAHTWPVDSPGTGGTAETPQLPPFTEQVIEVDAQSGGHVVSWGRTEPLSGSAEAATVEADIFIASVGEPAWLAPLAPGVYLPVLAAVGEGRFLLAGGATDRTDADGVHLDSGQDGLYELELVPPSADLAFSRLGTLPSYVDAQAHASHTARTGASLSVLPTGTDAGKLLLVGGSTGPGWLTPGDITTDAALYDPAAGRWEPLNGGLGLSLARSEHLAIPTDSGSVVVAGGWANAGSGLTPADTVEVYDPIARAFGAPVDAPDVGAVGLVGASLEGRGTLVCGGALVSLDADLTGGTFQGSQACVFLDPNDVPQAGAPLLPSALVGAAMIGLPNGGTLLTGGAIVDSGDTYDLAEYLPATNRAWILPEGLSTWQTLGYMPFPVAGHTMAPLPDGRIVLAGGSSQWSATAMPTDASSCVEIFDPKDNSFSVLDSCDPSSLQGGLASGAWRPQAAVDPLYGVLLVGGALPGREGAVAATQSTLVYPSPPGL